MEAAPVTLKLALLALALLVGWFVLFRPRRAPTPRPKVPPPAALAPCPDCGVYRAPGGECACDPPSTAAK